MTLLNQLPRSTPGRTRRGARPSRTGAYLLVVLTAGAYLPSPLYPTYQAAFGASDLTMTLVYAVFALVSAPALILLGPAADGLGARPVLRLAVALAALGSACFALATGPGWLLAGRAAQGLALGAATGAAMVLISAGDTGVARARGAVVATTAFLGGTAAGPVAAGLLVQFAPAPELTPYLLHGVLLWIGWRRLTRLSAPAPDLRRWRPTSPAIPRGLRPVFTGAALTGFLAWGVAGLFLSVIPTLLARGGQPGVAVTGVLLGAVLACSVAVQPLLVRWGALRAQLTGLAALAASLGLLATGAGSQAWLTLAAAVVAGTGHGLAFGGATDAVGSRAPAHRRGAVNGALHLAFYLGAGAPAVAIGLLTLSGTLSEATTWVSGLAATLIPIAAIAVLRGQRRTCTAQADGIQVST